MNPDADGHSQQGYDYYIQGEFGLAIEEYTKAIQLDPYFDLAYFQRGNAFFILSQSNEALRDLGQAIMLDPNDPDYYFGLGLKILQFHSLQFLNLLCDLKLVRHL